MKVLFYNWCPVNDKEGGGIAVYQRNILNYINTNDTDIQPVFLTSGFYYDGAKTPYIREEEPLEGAREFSIVNSPVYAPMRAPADNFQMMLRDETLKTLFGRFLEDYGPFDAVHFQTLEGLALNVLSLKEQYPQTTFLYSVHNYTAVCPNVMLWTEHDENCQALPEAEQNRCNICMNRYDLPATSFLKRSRHLLEKGHGKAYYYTRGVKFVTRTYFPVRRRNNNDVYLRYIRESVSMINSYIDVVLAVSEKVRDVVIRRGFDEGKVRTCYIGTKFAGQALGHSITEPEEDPFGIVYMGYMRKEKGFYFLLSALEQMDDDIASRMSVTFASKVTDRSAAKRIHALEKRFHTVRLMDGYTHEDIPDIMRGAHLGIVPVLWEDNLPQVTIEMIACGVPVLASSYGGASELSRNPDFRFEGNDTEDFIEKLTALFQHRQKLSDYWKDQVPLTTMDAHVEALIRYYKSAQEHEGNG